MYETTEKRIKSMIEESIEAKKKLPVGDIEKAYDVILGRYKQGGRLLICGNGGSAADAQHMAGEFVNKFKIERKPFPCIALTTDTSIMSAIGNDYSFDDVFSKQVEANGLEKDILLGISTSGNSKNIIRAVEKAREKSMYTICFLGRDGGNLAKICDLPIIVPSYDTPRIQEGHELIMHILCELVEEGLSGQKD